MVVLPKVEPASTNPNLRLSFAGYLQEKPSTGENNDKLSDTLSDTLRNKISATN
jgi:hypothetical protein